MNIAAPTPEAVERAAMLLRAGKLVAIPTETVYGLGADALDGEAVAGIFAAKGRPADHPLIVHLPDAEHLPHWAASIPKEAVALARAFWPGPLTLILRRAPDVPDVVTGGQDTVGLRVPDHPVALAVLRAFDSGIAAPSANRFGRISPTTAAHVHEELGDRVAMILDGGPCAVGIESTILDLSRDRPAILRPGAISAEQIAAVIGRQPDAYVPPEDAPVAGASVATRNPSAVIGQAEADAVASGAECVPRVSGSLAAHYAPRTALELHAAEALIDVVRRYLARGKRVAVLAHGVTADETLTGVAEQGMDAAGGRIVWHQAPSDAAGFAHDLYGSLRSLDAEAADVILVEAPGDGSTWQAVRDRLSRAATGSGDGHGSG